MPKFGIYGERRRERLPKNLAKLKGTHLFSFGLGVGPNFNGARGFNPLGLFAAGEQGGWYDPSDITSMFQDSTGTTAAAVNSPVGLMLDKRLGGAGADVFGGIGNPFTSVASWPILVGDGTRSVAGGKLTLNYGTTSTTVGTSFVPPTTSAYIINFTVDSISAGSVRILVGSAPGNGSVRIGTARTAPGAYQEIVFLTGGSTYYVELNKQDAGSVVISLTTSKPLAGNHLIQATSAARPTLKALYNRLTANNQASGWTNAVASGSTAATVTEVTGTLPDGTTGTFLRFSCGATAAGGSFSFRYSLSSITTGTVSATARLWVRWNSGGTQAAFTLAGTSSAPAVANGDALINITPAWQEASVSCSSYAVSGQLYLGVGPDSRTTAQAFVAASVFDVWMPDLRPTTDAALNIPKYQRVTTLSDYDTSGFPMYLEFDGVDDGLASAATVDLSGTNKVTLWAGVHKASDAAVAILAEHTTNGSAIDGGFYLTAPENAATPNYGFVTRGTASPSQRIITTFTAPVTTVLSVSLDNAAVSIATQVIPRANGVSPTIASGAGPTTVTNFANATFYVGRRAAASLPFIGRLYQLILRGAFSTAIQISSGEAYIASKTGMAL